jgi:hypothetical protein
VVIPNFCETPSGGAPDMGAQQAGTPPMVFGIKAEFIPGAASEKRPAASRRPSEKSPYTGD